MILKIYVRNDLNMRKGKMASQCAHAGLKYFLDICELDGHRLFAYSNALSLLREWYAGGQKIVVIPISSEKDMLGVFDDYNYEGVLIEDLGRTEFSGEKTLTAMAVMDGVDYNAIKKESIQKVNSESKGDQKQVFVVANNKKINKFDLSEHVARSSIDVILNKVNKFGYVDIESDGLMSWMTENFAKIVLQSNREDFDILVSRLNNQNELIYSETDSFMVAIGGDDSAKINKYTETFKLF